MLEGCATEYFHDNTFDKSTQRAHVPEYVANIVGIIIEVLCGHIQGSMIRKT